MAISRPRERALLTLLALAPNTLVTIDRIVDGLWRDHPPQTARGQIQADISRIRRLIRDSSGADPIRTWRTGYSVLVEDGRSDLDGFTTCVAQAAAAAGAGDRRAAIDQLRAALACWRGPALADIDAPYVEAARVRLDEQRLLAYQQLVELESNLDHHAELIPELTDLVNLHPSLEWPVAQLMRALHHCGRAADALAYYRSYLKLLADEQGIDPSPTLQDLHHAILNGQIVPPRSSPVPDPVVRIAQPHQLPGDIRAFAGRKKSLAELDALLTNMDGQAPMTVTIVGGAGVGKTGLAVHWAHRAARHFPDGQLHLDLRGFHPTDRPMPTAEALRALLESLGVPPHQVPAATDAQAAAYRTLLSGQRILILLDNARDAAQVHALLPGSPGCMTLVTSRDHLNGLIVAESAYPMHLAPLSESEAYELLTGRLGTERIASEPAPALEIAQLCAGLPLALAVVAARAASHSRYLLADLVDELRDSRDSLEAFADNDPAADVRAVFSWSYRALSIESARLFRLLGLHPGYDIAMPAAASLAGTSPARVRSALAELTRVNLLTEQTPGRFALHDLVRAYATELTLTLDGDDDRRDARHRILDHYLHTAHGAAVPRSPHHESFTPTPPLAGVSIGRLSQREPALAWFNGERPQLLAAIDAALEARFNTHAWQLAQVLVDYFDHRGYWQDWIETQKLAIEAAGRLDDAIVIARAHRSLARAYLRSGDKSQAEQLYRLGITLAQRADDPLGAAHSHYGLAITLEIVGRFDEALDHARLAYDHYVHLDERIGEGRSMTIIGWLRAKLGEHAEGLRDSRRGIELCRAAGDPLGEAYAWDSAGIAHHYQREYDRAADCFYRSLQLLRELGDRKTETVVLTYLGDTHYAAGADAAAREAWQRAASILDELHADASGVRDKIRELDVIGIGPRTWSAPDPMASARGTASTG